MTSPTPSRRQLLKTLGAGSALAASPALFLSAAMKVAASGNCRQTCGSSVARRPRHSRITPSMPGRSACRAPGYP